jgi:hypothetical protein
LISFFRYLAAAGEQGERRVNGRLDDSNLNLKAI